MKMSFGLELNQTQKMILTTELKQSLEVLQMNRFELEKLINEEINENPTIEATKKDEIDWEKYIKDMSENTYKISKSLYEVQDEDSEHNPENFIKEKINMYDYLQGQLRLLKISGHVFKGACYIIRTLDKDGYFKEPLESASINAEISLKDMKKALKAVQSLEPSGIGSRSIEECLIIQLRENEKHDEILENIIKNDLGLIGNKKYKELCKKYSITEDTLRRYIGEIRSLEPRPARALDNEDSKYVFPDVVVEKANTGFIVRSNDDSLPKLTINNFYQSMIKNKEAGEAKEYIKDKLQKSLLLIKNIEQRKNTILKVAQEIVDSQHEFFEKGKGSIKPMILKDIAERTGYHESTISRTVNGKYMLTPYGLFEFRYFFGSGLMDDSGEMISNLNVKDKIKALTDKENKKKPLSDQKICDLLNKEGINISRRTVAKYREELQIPSSSSRKEI